MKLHLPKQLLVAVLAVMSFSIAEGDVYVGITDTIYTEGEIPLYSTGTAEGATTTGVTHLVYYNADADGKVINNANIDIEAENVLWVGSGNEAYTAAASATKPTLVQLNGIITGSGTLKLNEYPSSANNIVIYELTNSASTFSGTISLQNGHGTHADNQLNLSGVGTAYQNAVVDCIANVPGIINIGSSVTIGGLSSPNDGRVTSTSVDNTLTLNVASDKIFGGTLGTGTYHTYSTSEGDTTFATATSKAINLVKTGSASQTINGAANLGTVTVNAGTLNLNGATTFNGNVTNNANLNLNSDVTIAESASVTIGGTGTTVYNKTITNYGNLTITGGITVNDLTQLTLKSSGTQAGYTDGDNGFAIVNGASYYLVDGTGTLSITNGTITVGDATNVVLDTTSEAGKASFVSSTSYSNEYYVNKAASLSSDTATAYVVNDTLTFTDEISGYKELAVQGEGQIKATFTGGNHSKALQLGNSFNGKLSILGGHMELGAFTYGGNAVLELISGQSWNNATINNAVELNAADLDSSYDFAYSTVTLAGKVTGNYMQVTGSDNGSVTINNAETSIEQVKVTGRTLNLQNGAIENLTMTGGTTNVRGGAITGDVVVSGGTINITGGTITTVDFANTGNLNFKLAEGQSSTSYTLNSISYTTRDNYERNVTIDSGVNVNLTTLDNGWGMGTLTVNGELNVSEEFKLATGDNNSTTNNVITGSGTINTTKLIIGNSGTYNISGVTMKIGAGGIKKDTTNYWGGYTKTNLGAVLIEASADWESDVDTLKLVATDSASTVINTASHTVDLKAGISGTGNLTKTGEGTLKIGTKTNALSGAVEVSGGSLSFYNTEADASTTLDNLTLSGGTLDVTRSLTLNALSIDLSKYSTDQEIHTLVSAGTLSLGAGVNLSSLGGNVGNYTATVAQSGNTITLSLKLEDVTSTDWSLVGTPSYDTARNMLTLNVGADLMNYDFTNNGTIIIPGIDDAMMKDILGLSGLPEDGMVGITLVGGDGQSVTATADQQIGFQGKDGIYYGEQVGSAWQYQVAYIPEPASATLGLAALMMLAARRRRKD